MGKGLAERFKCVIMYIIISADPRPTQGGARKGREGRVGDLRPKVPLRV